MAKVKIAGIGKVAIIKISLFTVGGGKMSEIIIFVDKLPRGCDKCAYLIPKGYKAGYLECKFTGYVSERDNVPNFRSESCPLRLRSRYVELPEGLQISDEHKPKAVLTMMLSENFQPAEVVSAIFVKRVEVEE